MRLIAVAAVMLVGCASSPEQLAATPTYRLCVRYAEAILSPHRDTWLEEVYRRGETCAPYAAEMGVAGAQAQSTLNSLNARYGLPPAPPTPTPMPSQVGGVTAFLKSQRVEGNTRFCIYDALGSLHVVTLNAIGICPLSVKAQR